MSNVLTANHVEFRHQTAVTRFDRILFYTTLALMVFGLVAVYTASAHQAEEESGNSLAVWIKQALAFGLGIPLMLTLSKMHFQRWYQSAHAFAAVCVVLLLITLSMGVTANGSERWIALPFGFNLQPSDFAKIAAIFLMAQITSASKWFNVRFFFNLALVGVMTLLIFQQPNLSVSMILAFLTIAMLFVSGLPWPFLLFTLPVAGYAVVQKVMHTEYQMRRITGWIDPWKDPLDSGYNLIQSYYAIGNGGFLGTGLGHSIQKLYYLPFQHTDFIFSVICEELGFLGALILIGLFCMMAWRGFYIAFNCPNRFGQMLAFGITLAITLQAFINICVTIGLMPVTGVTLPLISYGGTSVITTLAMIGILLNISRYRQTIKI